MRMFAEVEANLLPWIKKTEYFKKKNTKDADLVEIASHLKYECFPKDTHLNDTGRIYSVNELVESFDEKFWIILAG